MVITVLIFISTFSYAEEKAQEVKKAPSATKPTGAMVACDRKVNKAAIMKVLAALPLQHFGSNFSLKSSVYYPAQVDDESFDVGVIADKQEYDATVTMDEKCKKVLEVKVEKL